jgi:Lrp/AsnC family leucine-responsive transcriptional regulator
LIKVRARDAEHLGQLLRTRLGRIPGVRSTRTTIVLETVKETSRLPLGLPEGQEGKEEVTT